ncbi:MAG: thioredoxin family protein [Anaerolineae bacterium]
MDGIERDLEGEAEVLRLGVMNGVGRELAIRYGVRSVPTLVLLDGNGDVVLKQAGSPRRGEIVAAVEQLTR